MRYFYITCGNGYCGCDEEWIEESPVEIEADDVYENYTYQDGAAGLRIGDDEDDDITSDEYFQNIMDSISIEEISEEEFMHYRDSECVEVR